VIKKSRALWKYYIKFQPLLINMKIKKSTLFITLFTIISFQFIFGQKKEVYANDNLEIISKKEFDEIDPKNQSFLNLKFDVDSMYINIKAKRIKKGKISTTTLDLIKLNLSSNTNYFDKNDIIIINYYPGKDNCNSSGDKDLTKKHYKNFLNKINKNTKVKQFFIYHSLGGTENYGKFKWIEDKNSLIKKTFFPLHYPCDSFLLIDQFGNYYVSRGENNVDEIFKLLKNQNTFVNTSEGK
jgi:hypothetical protein